MNRELAETLLAQLIADELDEASRAQLLAYLKTDAVLSETLGDMRIAAGLVHKGLNAGDALELRSEQRAALEALIASGEESQQAASRRNAEGSETVSSDTGAASHSTLESIDPHDAPRLAASPDLNNESPPILFTLRGASAAAACVAISIGAVGLLLPSQGGTDSPSASAIQENGILADAQAIGFEISEDVIPIQNIINAPRAPRETRSIYSNSGGDLEGSVLWTEGQNGNINTRYGEFAPGSNDEADLLALALTQTQDGGANGGGGGGRGLFDDDSLARLEGETGGYIAGLPITEAPDIAIDQIRSVQSGPTLNIAGDLLVESDQFFSFSVDLPFQTDPSSPIHDSLGLVTDHPSFDLNNAHSNSSEGLIPREAPQLAASPDLLTQSPAAETLGRQLDRIETRYRFGDEHFDEEYGVDLDIAFNTPNTDTLLNVDTDGDGIPDATDGLPDNGSQWERLTITGNSASGVASTVPSNQRESTLPQERLAQAHEEIDRLHSQLEGESRRVTNNLVVQARTQMAGNKEAEASEALAQGQVNLAAQLYEEALMLDPGNEALQGRLAQAQTEAAQSQRPASPIAGAAQDRTIARQESIARYEESMQRASVAIANGEFDAAIDATNNARIVLNASRSSFGQPEYNEMQARAARMTAEVNSTQQRNDAMASADAERIRFRDERSASAEAERAQRAEVQRLLHAAREQQLARNYDQALRSLEAAQFLDPDNPAVEALLEIIQDTRVGVDARRLRRDLNLMRSNQQLINDEAIIPYDELLTYPGDWPQLTQMRLQGLDSTAGEEEANRAAELALRRIVSLDVEAVELQDVIEYIRDATGANIAVNWPALELEGITPDQPISINLSRVPAELLLRLALEQAGAANQGNDKPGYLITEGVLVISTLNDLGAEEPDVAPALETETPANYPVNPWVLTQNDALSTFAVDVDTASYQLARRHIIERAQIPAASSIRMEEFVNRFDYNYPAGQDAAETFRVHLEAGPAPFADEGIVLVKVGIRGRVVARDQQKPAHLVFVIDASGSMAREDRLPLVQQSLAIILEQLGERDTVTLVSYDTAPYLLIEHASARNRTAILEAALSIQTRGSTNLIDGMRLGYQVAARHFESGAVNRVILCSDGVANVGSDDAVAMLDAISQYRQQGVTLTTLGVGIDEVGETGGQSGGGLNDHLLEQLANRGDGRYLYLGSLTDAHRLLATELSATAPIIARDVKIQVAFDPDRVRRYRLIGYENRAIADADFRNDSVDAGEVFSGQSATALYEIELHPPRNQDPRNQGYRAIGNDRQADLGQVFVRYHDTRTGKVEETQCALSHDFIHDRTPSDDPRFYLAACAAEFAERLRESEHSPGMASSNDETLERLISQVAQQLPLDTDVAELKALIEQSRGLPRSQ